MGECDGKKCRSNSKPKTRSGEGTGPVKLLIIS